MPRKEIKRQLSKGESPSLLSKRRCIFSWSETCITFDAEQVTDGIFAVAASADMDYSVNRSPPPQNLVCLRRLLNLVSHAHKT